MTRPSPESAVVTEAELRQRVAELGAEISHDYDQLDLCLVCVLKGAIVFLADLMRQLTIPCAVECIRLSSYGTETESSGTVKIHGHVDIDIKGKHVLIVEDVIETGLTLRYLTRTLRALEPASLNVCALLLKERSGAAGIQPQYAGFSISNDFVVGYGLDLSEEYRALPYIAALNQP